MKLGGSKNRLRVLPAFLLLTLFPYSAYSQDTGPSDACAEPHTPRCRQAFASRAEQTALKLHSGFHVGVAGEEKDVLIFASSDFKKQDVLVEQRKFVQSEAFLTSVCKFAFRKIRLVSADVIPKAGTGEEHEISCPPSAQDSKQTPAIESQTSAIEGSVFLITAGGDIKPARFAKMAGFSSEAKGVYGHLSAIADYISRMRGSSNELDRNLAESECSIQLVKLWETSRKTGEFEKQTDELGKFSYENVTPGVFTIIVFGRAGLNVAVWISEVTNEAGDTTNVKMSKPIIACFDPKSIVTF